MSAFCYDVSVRTCDQLEALGDTGLPLGRVYADAYLVLKEGAGRVLARIPEESRKNSFIALPFMTRTRQQKTEEDDLHTLMSFPGFAGMLVRNLEQLAFLTKKDYRGELITDYGLYVWNHRSLQSLREMAPRLRAFSLSPELSCRQMEDVLRNIPEDVPALLCVYGHTPMMVSANCVRQSDPADACSGLKGSLTVCEKTLIDRTDREMRVTCECRSCYNVIWNAYPVSLHAYVRKVSAEWGAIRLRLDFTVEDADETMRAARFFAALAESEEDTKPPFPAFTTGRFRKGVE